MEYHLEPHERRKKSKEEREGKKSGFLNLILLQLILCVLTAIIILFGNLIFSGSVNSMKEYYVSNILSDNSLESNVRSAVDQVIAFLNQPASDTLLSDSSSSETGTSSQNNSESGQISSEPDSSESSPSSQVTSETAEVMSSAGGEFNPVWEQTITNFNPAPLKLGQEETQKICIPLHGPLSCDYGYRLHPITGLPDFHKGVDLPADEGTPILAAMDGTVMTAGVSASFGNYVVIQHADSLVTRYGHCSRLNVEQGQEVQAGDIVGFVGNTGYSTGNHLHFDVSRDGTYFDPHQLFPSFD